MLGADALRQKEKAGECIFCRQEKSNLSEEHVFPESIGGSIVIYRVCRDCNTYLGQRVDPNLSDEYYVAKRKVGLNISGKRGKTQFSDRKFKLPSGEAMRATKNIPERKIEYYLETVVDSSDEKRFHMTVDERHIERIFSRINALRKEKGLSAWTLEEMRKHIPFQRDAIPGQYAEIGTEPLAPIQQAIVKIVYEMACVWLGEAYLEDDIGQVMREFVLDRDAVDPAKTPDWGAKYLLRGKIRKVGVEAPNAIMTDKEDCHIAAFYQGNDGILCYVRIFTEWEAMLLVSEHPERYSSELNKRVIIDPCTGKIEATDSQTLRGDSSNPTILLLADDQSP